MNQQPLFDDLFPVGHGRELYPTNDKVTAVLARRLPQIGGHVAEPCAGPGMMVRAIQAHFPRANPVTSMDVDPYWSDYVNWIGNATDPSDPFWKYTEYDWVITNPPFSIAPAILANAFNNCRVGVAFLLPVTFLEPCEDRGRWLQDHADHMTHKITVNPRPKFIADKSTTDNKTVSWFVWKKEWSWAAQGIECPFQFETNWDKRQEGWEA